MDIFAIEIFSGLLSGIVLSVTGISPFNLLILLLDYLKIGNHVSNIGLVLFINLFPISIGGVYEFYKANKINYKLGFILLVSVIIGSYIGSKLILGKTTKLSVKTIKYITAFYGLILFITYLIKSNKFEN
jgi:uncharacterized membrane protein YfcA